MKTAIITGASSGIGKELARCYAQNNHHVVLVARSKDKLAELAKEVHEHFEVKVTVVPMDLTADHAPQVLFDKLESKGIACDVLINNAGFGGWGDFSTTDWKYEQKMISLNCTALTGLAKHAIKEMRKRGGGKILNVASMAGFIPGPMMAVYYATKAYVVSFSQSLAYENKKHDIAVSCLCPGATKTEFDQGKGLDESKLFKGKLMSAERVAWAGYHGLRKNRILIIPGFGNKLFYMLSKLLPQKLQSSFAYQAQKKA